MHIFEILNLNMKRKDCKSFKNLFTKNFTYTAAAVNFFKNFLPKNAKKKKTCKRDKRNLNYDWINTIFKKLMRFKLSISDDEYFYATHTFYMYHATVDFLLNHFKLFWKICIVSMYS